MNEKNPPLNKEGCHWGGSISRSKTSNLSITVDVGTDKLQQKLRAIAKHTEALAAELDAIDNARQCEREKCGEHYMVDDEDLPIRREVSD